MTTASKIQYQSLADSGAIADIQFCDNYLPALVADTYTITISHQITAEQSSGLPTNPFTQTQQFAVEGPRFNLNATDIQTQFPANKSQGQFDQQFPYIVLTKRALPWERLLQAGGDKTIPWLALLVFQPSEIILENTNGSSLGNLTMTQSYPLSQIVSPEAGVVGPTIQLSQFDDATATCQAIDISPVTFAAVVPRLNELKYLAHVRQLEVDTLQYKAESELQGTGWYSLVMANRLPIAPSGSTSSVRNIVHLVSLEGFQSYLENPTFPSTISKIRLVSLASWTFDCLADAKENFSTLMSNFVTKAKSAADLALKMPAAPASSDPNQQLAQSILNNGFVPLSYRTRSGDQTYSWYRSPLTPVRVQEYTAIPPYTTAESALIYDSNTGLFDQSYAVMWQTGRFLALADRSFAISVLNWRRQTNQALQLLAHRLNSPHVSTALKQTETVEQIRQLLHPRLISESFMNFLGHGFAEGVALKAAELGYKPQPQPKSSERAPKSSLSVHAFQQFMQQPETPALFNRVLLAMQPEQAEATEVTPANTIPPDILTWLSRLALLYGVPFDKLVPNQQMLPTESIRFFYINPNAIDSLIDGALSLGVQSSQDSLFNQLAKPLIRQAVHQAIPTIRTKMLGTVADSSPVPQPMAGFLLRSQVVSGFPGLEIKSYQTVTVNETTNELEPSNLLMSLRMEWLTPDVMLCLLPSIPAWIELNEPKESFGFGVEAVKTNTVIYLRNVVTDSQPGSIIQPEISQPIPFRSSSTVVDIQTLQQNIQKQLQGKLNNSDGIISPAEFAIQLIREPEKMVFQNHA
ncbi:MAG: hypothetical protein KME07_05585 [Pegethrix bostrychoides GSE-TBD4-15B]|jgi:hypothetical protein|uniref:Uncharacterized protein n=1 Tax=Pegethrix bostrychoides GSE-TBD4-15B TaxID=2839662 RepID=A0A951U402_9CYAN|nr:hypothetical protein [Pegethrix bostrychoides GSE-TBD4-15B]